MYGTNDLSVGRIPDATRQQHHKGPFWCAGSNITQHTCGPVLVQSYDVWYKRNRAF